MTDSFAWIVLTELRKEGFNEAKYDARLEHIFPYANDDKIFIGDYDDHGTYHVRHNRERGELVQRLIEITRRCMNIYSACNRDILMLNSSVSGFHTLLKWNDVILAARNDGDRGLHFVTWSYSPKKDEFNYGHYTTNFKSAERDFAIRSGMIPEEMVFDNEQLTAIHKALSYRRMLDEDILYEEKEVIDSLLLRINSLLEQEMKPNDNDNSHN